MNPECSECGEKFHPRRRELGYYTCLECGDNEAAKQIFRNRNSIQISKLQLNQAETRLSGGTKSAKVSLYALINTLNNYQEIIPIQEEVLFSAEEDLKLAQQRYELGSASILELLDAQLALIRISKHWIVPYLMVFM